MLKLMKIRQESYGSLNFHVNQIFKLSVINLDHMMVVGLKKKKKKFLPTDQVEVKRFTEITVHRGSVVTIRFTILFLRVSIQFGSLKCKQKLSINCQLDW